MKKEIGQRIHSKTYWLGFGVLFLGYLQQNFSLIDSYLGDYKNAVYFVVGVLILIMRELTTQPLSEKKKNADIQNN